MYVFNATTVLCDIEGTTTAVSFVKDVLFPYAKNHSKDYLQENWDEDTTKQIVADLIALSEYKEFQKQKNNENDTTVEAVAKFVIYLIDNDFKLSPLKTLQGLIWSQAYADNTIKGHIYEDVPHAFEKWTKDGIQVFIYSSGSVKAQKLLFGNSDFGNLMPFLTDYFDTAVGNKQDPKSYTNILSKLGVKSEKLLFLTDIVAEAKAAKQSGIQVVILQRPGNAILTEEERKEYIVVKNFNEIKINKISEF